MSPLPAELVAYLTSPLTWCAFVFGALIGSFLNVCIVRIPQKTFFKHARSVCPHCGAPIPAYYNIPILSFLWLRGRAACCHKPISWQYPAVELLTAIMFVVIYWYHPFVRQMPPQAWLIDPADFIRFCHMAVFTSVMIVCAVIDLEHQIIPDVLSLSMIALTPLVVYLQPELSWQSALLGVVVGGGVLYAIAWIYYLLRREAGLGMGDVKLLAGIGGWLGAEAIFPTLLTASVLGAVVGLSVIVISGKKTLKTAIPFGPFLVLGALGHYFIGHHVATWLFRP